MYIVLLKDRRRNVILQPWRLHHTRHAHSCFDFMQYTHLFTKGMGLVTKDSDKQCRASDRVCIPTRLHTYLNGPWFHGNYANTQMCKTGNSIRTHTFIAVYLLYNLTLSTSHPHSVANRTHYIQTHFTRSPLHSSHVCSPYSVPPHCCLQESQPQHAAQQPRSP